MPSACDDAELEALERAREEHFGPPTWQTCGQVVPESALGLAALADTKVLGGLAVNDLSVAMVKMLAFCVNCGSSPSVCAAAFDEGNQWFTVSHALCFYCFSEKADCEHVAFTRVSDRDNDVAEDKSDERALERQRSSAGRDGVPTMLRSTVARRIRSLAQRGAVRVLQFVTIGGPPDLHRRGHRRRVLALRYSPDGSTIATGGEDSTVRLWCAVSSECHRVLEGHSDGVLTVAFSPDGATLATGSADKTVRLWDLASGRCQVALRGHTDVVNEVQFHPFTVARLLTATLDGTLRIWDTTLARSLRVKRNLTGYSFPVVLSPACSSIAMWLPKVALFDCEKNSWSTLDGEPPMFITRIVYSPDSTKLVIASMNGKVQLWDVASCKRQRVFEFHGSSGVYALASSPDGSKIAAGDENNVIRVWDTASGQCICVLRGGVGEINHLTFSPDGATLSWAEVADGVRHWRDSAHKRSRSHSLDR